MTKYQPLDKEIDAHLETNCPACVASVTGFAPVCPVLADLYRRNYLAAKKAKAKKAAAQGRTEYFPRDPGEEAADRWLEGQVGI